MNNFNCDIIHRKYMVNKSHGGSKVKKKFKSAGIPLIIIAFIFISANQVIGFLNKEISLFNLLVSISVGVLFIAQLCYSNYYNLFKFVHKMKLFILNPTVIWESRTLIQLNEAIKFKEICNDFYDELLESEKIVKRSISNDMDFKVKVNHSDLSIHYDEHTSKITIIYNSKISYRASLKEFENLVDDLLESFTSNIRVGTSKSYEILIKFGEHNPFYKLNVKHLEENNVEKFELKANLSPLKLEVTKNRMVIKSRNKNAILEASRDYFAL